jgi:hypothetical protein
MPVPRVDQTVERPFEDLAQKASQQAVVLAREQVDVARRELTARAREAGPGVAMIGGGAVLTALASGTATAALILLLARRPGASAAALGVTGGYVGASAVLARRGLMRLREAGPPVPDGPVQDKAVQNGDQDLESAKQPARSAAKSARRAKSTAKSARLTKPAAESAQRTESAAKPARQAKSAAKPARQAKSAAKPARQAKSAAKPARQAKSAATLPSGSTGRPKAESKTPSSRPRASGARTDRTGRRGS